MADISKIKPNGASGTEYNLKDATARAAMIPSGGTQGQVLVKKTGTDYDTEWSNGGGTTVVANPSGTATDDLTKVQIGSTIYDVTDKDAMRGVSIKVSSDTTAERYYLIWEHIGAPQGYISPLQISGDIGGWTGGTKFDVSCVFNNIGNIPRIYGFKESDVGANIIITRTSTSSSDSNTHDRIYIHFPVGIRYAEANINIIPPESGNGQGTFYTNPTATTTYEGTLATSLAACPVTNKLAGLSDVNISNPQNGQILQYDAASQKWANGAGSSDKADISAIGTNETGATASKAYAVGEHFYKNGKFCTAKTAIASGAQFTLDTNYVEGTIADNKPIFVSLSPYDTTCTIKDGGAYIYSNKVVIDLIAQLNQTVSTGLAIARPSHLLPQPKISGELGFVPVLGTSIFYVGTNDTILSRGISQFSYFTSNTDIWISAYTNTNVDTNNYVRIYIEYYTK